MFAPLNAPIRDWRERRVWLVGASSGIGAALARALLERGARVALTARRPAALADVAGDALAGERSLCVPADVTDAAAVRAAHDEVLARWGGIDVAIWVAGTWAPMRSEDFDLGVARQMLDTNLAGVLNGLAVLLPTLRRQGSGGIALVSSVAGYRGLPRSLVYGPTKAALNHLAEALYLDLHPQGVGVWLIAPGFVDTPLTSRNDFPMPALIGPDEAAARILEGFARGRFEIHFPARFTRVLGALRLLPHRWYFAIVRRATRGPRGARAVASHSPR
ncbi:MAG: SDR family NAD(P)-dependent oxidoreductase [Burkholderiaceae bacterium]